VNALSPRAAVFLKECRQRAFTLVELLVVIAVISILAALLLPVLSNAKEQAKNVSCKNNLKQLQLCVELYSDDFNNFFPPNCDIDTIGGSLWGQVSWCEGNGATDTNTSNIVAGLLYPYDRDALIYHCPSDLSTVKDANGNPTFQLRDRSYNMSQSINAYGWMIDPSSGAAVDVLQRCFQKVTDVTNPPTSRLFCFIDENENTMYDSQFGYPPPNMSAQWWDMPSNRHTQGANLSFADGHVEYWHWVIPETAPTNIYQLMVTPVSPAGMPDFTRVGNAMRQVPVDGLAD
jgi:prepilin-type N-terminal cleavage/methylation domain-containing protein/prepilin-type processing-associated H-X9-DG protein